MKAGDLVVKSHQPVRGRAFLISTIVMAVLVIVGVYNVGLYQGGYLSREANARQASMAADIANLQQDKSDLQGKIIMLTQTQAIDMQAYEEVRGSLKQLQEEILELRQEVEFYRGIVSPAERLAGIAIQSFTVTPMAEEGLYHYELVLTQMLKNDKFVRGRVNIYVNGAQDGEPKKLQFQAISPNNSVKRELRFRYFQKMEGDVRLPQGFVPRDVVVEMVPKGRKQITQAFSWEGIAG